MKILMITILSLVLLFGKDFSTLEQVIEKTNDSLSDTQKAIDKLDDKKSSIFDEYLNYNIKLENVQNSNKLLLKQVAIQNEKIQLLQENIDNIEKTKSEIFPLLKSMYESLEQLLILDAPFLLEERKQRLKNTQEYLLREDISKSEKFRKLLEVYDIEYDYANTIQSYKETKDETTYTFLRIGRIGLYRQSLDKNDFEIWNNKEKKWVKIKSLSDKINISNAIKIANKQLSPILLTLPFAVVKDKK